MTLTSASISALTLTLTLMFISNESDVFCNFNQSAASLPG
ncbi:MAG: hypothetical protein EZS28_041343, partial [Streblomastix strix]